MPCEEVFEGHTYTNDTYGGEYLVNGLEPDMTFFEMSRNVGQAVLYTQLYDGEIFSKGKIHRRLMEDFRENFTPKLQD